MGCSTKDNTSMIRLEFWDQDQIRIGENDMEIAIQTEKGTTENYQPLK